MPVLTVVFDLDGTLVETAPDLCSTLNVVLAAEGHAEVDYKAARTMVGAGARVMIERGVVAGGRAATPAEIDRMFAAFIDHYATHIADRSHVFPGLIDALDKLAAQGCVLAVCTNKLEGLSRLLLEALGLTKRFAAIVGQDTFGVPKPDPSVLRRTILAAGGDPAHAVMVGDSETDIRTARAAGVPVVAVDFGYTETPVTELGPDRVISHFDALPEAVFALAGHAA
jgi:phosphoglycolate phosphatase